MRPRWLEEPVPPDRVGDLALIRREGRTPIATGEHEYTRWGFLRLLQAEARRRHSGRPGLGRRHQRDRQDRHARLCLRAAGRTAWALSCRRRAYYCCDAAGDLPVRGISRASRPHEAAFSRTPFVPENGSFALPTAPGLGLDLDPDKVERRAVLWEERG